MYPLSSAHGHPAYKSHQMQHSKCLSLDEGLRGRRLIHFDCQPGDAADPNSQIPPINYADDLNQKRLCVRAQNSADARVTLLSLRRAPSSSDALPELHRGTKT